MLISTAKQVLFCGEEFSKGFEYSKAALESSSDVLVRLQPVQFMGC